MNTQNTIPFSIEAYQELVVEKGTHEVRNGHNLLARILATEAKVDDVYTLLVLITLLDGTEKVEFYSEEGMYNISGQSEYFDLVIVPKPPVSLGWVVIYKFDVGDKVLCTEEPFKTPDALLAWAKRFPVVLLSEPVEIFAKTS